MDFVSREYSSFHDYSPETGAGYWSYYLFFLTSIDHPVNKPPTVDNTYIPNNGRDYRSSSHILIAKLALKLKQNFTNLCWY